MTETTTHYFVFFVLPAIFIAVWACVFLYTRSVKAKIRKITGPGHEPTSTEAGIAAVTLEKERHSGKTANS